MGHDWNQNWILQIFGTCGGAEMKRTSSSVRRRLITNVQPVHLLFDVKFKNDVFRLILHFLPFNMICFLCNILNEMVFFYLHCTKCSVLWSGVVENCIWKRPKLRLFNHLLIRSDIYVPHHKHTSSTVQEFVFPKSNSHHILTRRRHQINDLLLSTNTEIWLKSLSLSFF